MTNQDDMRRLAPGATVVICSRCHAHVDLAQPLPREGWQDIHVCPGQRIEAMALRAGEPAWTWKAHSEFT